MSTISTDSLLEQLNWRYAAKQFDPSKRLDEKTVEAIEESLVLTPSSFGLQPWKFIVISSQELKDQLPGISWGQQQLKECSHVVVFTVQTGYTRENVAEFIARTASVRGMSEESLAGYEKFAGEFVDRANAGGWVDTWSTHQVYIAVGQLLLTAAALGVDGCPMEGIEKEKYDTLLGLEGTGYKTVMVCPLGYRSEEDKYATLPKVRFEKNVVLERR